MARKPNPHAAEAAEFLKEAERVRAKLGLSVAAWARKLDIHDSTYQWWLAGKRVPHRFMIVNLKPRIEAAEKGV
jgi:DNA-binding transcriptional regulator YiaG